MRKPSHHVNVIQNKKVILVGNSRRCEFSYEKISYEGPRKYSVSVKFHKMTPYT